MLVERRKYLRWVLFPLRESIRPSCRTVYLQTTEKLWLPTHIRLPFTSYVVDLSLSEDELMGSYSPQLRSDIRRAEKKEFSVIRDASPEALISIFKTVSRDRGLNILNREKLATKPSLLINQIRHADYGVLAAHAYLQDKQSKIVKLEYNASAYRQFPRNSTGRSLAGLANVLLFHRDFAYFRKEGFVQFDFGGLVAGEGVMDFKKKFGGRVVEQFNYYPLHYFWLRQVRSWLKKNSVIR